MRIVLLVLSMLPLAAEALETQYLHALRNIEYVNAESEIIGRSFHVYTMLPDGYLENTDRDYPTIYLLDGGGLFPMLVGYYRYLEAGGGAPESIIVGLSYGGRTFPEGNFRSTDYTAPSSEREWYGGAGDFQRFLADELMPRIERSYRSNPDRRIVFGHSIGGQFVLYTALTRPELFWGHLASNPALHRNLSFFLEQQPEEQSASRLFVASATNDEARFREPMLAWEKHWSEVAEKPWDYRFVHLDGHSHRSTPPEVFRQGLTWLFAVDSPD